MYLPDELAQHSSWSHERDEHFLKTPEAELREKEWDEERLREWEHDVNLGKPWAGRKHQSEQGHEAAALDFVAGSSPGVAVDDEEEEEEEEHYTQTDDDSWIK